MSAAALALALAPPPPADRPPRDWHLVDVPLRAQPGELDRAGWDRIGDALAASIGLHLVELDLSAASHAQPMPARALGYVRALRQAGGQLRVIASRYVRACVEASRYGALLEVDEWRLP